MTQFYSRIDATLNGDVYNIPFSYMKESEISVYINDEPITAWEFLNESQIKINEMPSEIPADAIVSIRRTTDITKKVVDYTNQSMLKKENLNLSQNQLLNAIQEVYDNNIVFKLETNDNFDDYKDTVNSQISTISGAVDTANTNASNAVSTANEANTKAGNAVSTANTASSNASTAVNTANNASTAAGNAVNTANTASETATNAKNKVESFEANIASVIEAAGKINELEEAIGTATQAASTASTKAQLASDKADLASDKATLASNKATEATNAADAAAATLANAVTLTGTQEISGAKTFTANKTVMKDLEAEDITVKDSTITFNDTTAEQTITLKQSAADEINISGSDGTVDVDVTVKINNDIVITEAVLEATKVNLQNQINYLQTKAVGVFSEYLNFLRAGSTHTALKIGENVSLKFKLGTEECLYSNSADDEFEVIDKLDSGSSLQAGKDYCVYMKKLAASTTGFDFVVSLNGTYPTGYTADEVYKIGGFHTLCLGVTSSNAPALKTGSFWSTHPAIGYNTADIISNSVWCLTHRPISEPNGMVYVDRRGKWFDIYLQSGTFSGTASVFGGTTTDTRQPILHQYDLLCVFKEMMDDEDFMTAMEGSNQGTNIAGSADPVTTGGHYDTAGKRMISGYYLEDGCGALWQWLKEIGFNGNQNWTGYGTNADQRGQTYGMPYVLPAGGGWADGSLCGSWCRACNLSRSIVGADCGCRGVSRSLFIGKVA